MSNFPAALIACLTVGSAAQAASALPAQKACHLPQRAAEHEGLGEGCMKAGPVRASFQGISTGQILRCGHLLSTDTLVIVHRWDRT